MAIHFTTPDAKSLLANFDSRISQKEPKGKITTWEKSKDGKYYTHKAAEWTKLAWFKPKVEATELTFNIIKPESKKVTSPVYAYYHGHMLETFLNHFDKDFKYGIATALAVDGDHVSSS